MSIFSSSAGKLSSTRTHGRSDKARAALCRREARAQVDQSAEKTFFDVLMASLWTLPIMSLLGLILLVVVTTVAYANADPDALTTPLALGILGLTSVLGGLISARRVGSRPLACGILTGLLFALLIFCVSLLFGDEARRQLTLGFSPALLWGLHGGVVTMSLIGAGIGSRKTTKTHNTRR